MNTQTHTTTPHDNELADRNLEINVLDVRGTYSRKQPIDLEIPLRNIF